MSGARLRSDDLGESYALRLLIHYVGDVHQPLHATTKVDHSFPNGDRGGNSFPLPNHYSVNNLHALWDSVIYKFHTTLKLVSIINSLYNSQPFDNASWAKIEETCEDMVADHPISSRDATNLNPMSWSEESHKIAENHVYKGIEEGAKVPQEYIDRTLSLAERQVVLGGHRLANLISKIFSGKTRE